MSLSSAAAAAEKKSLCTYGNTTSPKNSTNLVEKPEIFKEKFTADRRVRDRRGRRRQQQSKSQQADRADGLTFIPAERKACVTLDTGIRVRACLLYVCECVIVGVVSQSSANIVHPQAQRHTLLI